MNKILKCSVIVVMFLSINTHPMYRLFNLENFEGDKAIECLFIIAGAGVFIGGSLVSSEAIEVVGVGLAGAGASLSLFDSWMERQNASEQRNTRSFFGAREE